MNIESINPLEIKENWSLGAIFPDSNQKLYIWINYDSGDILFTKWYSVPKEFYSKRPIAMAYQSRYSLPSGLPCSKILNYGPAAGGLEEAGAFKIQTCGERIDALIPLLGFKNRDLGMQLIGRRLKEALVFIERFVGQFSISYASLFTLLGFDVSEQCKKYIFTSTELERIYNHIWVIHKLASDASQKVASAHFAAITEKILRLNLKILGHRYGMGFIRIGPKKYDDFHKNIKDLYDDFQELSEELLNSRIFIDRLHTTCTLKNEDIIKNDIGGIPARAAGILRDARNIGVMQEYYRNYQTPIENDGDALSRLLIRVMEVLRGLESLENVEFRACKLLPKNGFFYGIIEAPPGDSFMALKIVDNRVRDFMFRPASLPMYHAFSMGIRGNIFTDFPFALDSFGAYFADADSFGRWYNVDP